MNLVYINDLKQNHRGDYIYEFIFSDGLSIVAGENWDTSPPDGEPTPPNIEYIKKVGLLIAPEEVLTLFKNTDFQACMYDCVENVIAMAWESQEMLPDGASRLVFHYGDQIKKVEELLKKRNFKLIYPYDEEI